MKEGAYVEANSPATKRFRGTVRRVFKVWVLVLPYSGAPRWFHRDYVSVTRVPEARIL